MQIQAEHFAAARHHIDSVAFHTRRGQQTQVFPIVDLAGGELRHGELPQQRAVAFAQRVQDGFIVLKAGIAGTGVVGSDKQNPLCHHRIAVGLRAQLGDPLHIFGGREIDLFRIGFELSGLNRRRQALRRRKHVAAGIVAAPLRPVLGRSGKGHDGATQQGAAQRQEGT